MKAFRHLMFACSVGLVAALSAPVQAQAPAPVSAEMAQAEVRKVDKENRKITLKHGPIKNLDMPPMTMVFQVADAAMLDQVRAGDKVRFRAANEGGKYMVTEIQPVK